MKNQIKSLILLVGITVSSLLLAGCVSSGDLAPEGVYQGKAVLFNTDTTLNSAYASMDTFLKWEYDNRAVFSTQMPEIKKAADHIRANGQQWINSAFALRDVYELNPTEENRANLQQILTVIRTALLEAAKYMARTPPTNA